MKLPLIAAAAAAFTLSIATVQAAPLSPLAPLAPLSGVTNPDFILTAGGCGRGWHRGPYGGCRRNLSPAWPCWFTRGPYGRWILHCH